MEVRQIDLIKPLSIPNYYSYDLARTKLDKKQILVARAKEYHSEIYFETPELKRIRQKIIDTQLTFIVGNPLAGKTRIVFDTLNSLDTGLVIFPLSHPNIKEYKLPQRKDIFLFIDELDIFCEKCPEAIHNLLNNVLVNDIKCIITCRTGPELKIVIGSLNAQIWSRLKANKIEIHRIDKDNIEFKEFFLKNKDKMEKLSGFDGNIGSLFIDLEDMRRRFQRLVEDDEYLSIAILKGLKLHYHLYNFEFRKSHYNEAKIREFCNRYTNDKIENTEWDNAKRLILSTETTLNFIEERENIIIEEAYLDCNEDPSLDVVDETFTRYNIIKCLGEYYKDLDDRQFWGFPTKKGDWDIIIEKQETYEDAVKIFNEIPKSNDKTAYTYTLMIRKATTRDLKRKYYEEMLNQRLESVYAHTAYFGIYSDFVELFEAIRQSNKKLLKFSTCVSEMLIKLAKKDPKRSLEYLFKKNTIVQVFTNHVFIKICLECIETYDEYIRYIKPFLQAANELESNLLKTYIRICSKLKQREAALYLLNAFIKKDTDKYFYFNEKANCIKETQPEDALCLYDEAANSTTDKSLKARAYTNFAQLVYNKELCSHLKEAILKSNEAVRMVRHAEFPYARYALLLLIIWQTPLENLITRIHLLQKSEFKRNTFLKIIHLVKDIHKKQLLSDFFLSDLKDDAEKQQEEVQNA